MRTQGIIVLASAIFIAPPCFRTAQADQTPDHLAECRAALPQIENDFPLPQVAKAIKKKQLDILVVGAGSSTLPGANGVNNAYPARLQAALTEKLPDVTVKVTTEVKSGRTALESLKPIATALKATKPALLVWQTGTVDAMRQVELDTFNTALDSGVAVAQAAGSDVILVNSQYSPRTESMIALGAYSENIRWIALQHEIPLLDRFSIMKLWAELGTFDFSAPTKKLDMAERVHDCLGRLLADLIIEASKPVAPPSVR
jgi:hypothetical protein